MKFFEGWDAAYASYINVKDQNPNLERSKTVRTVFRDVVENPGKWGLGYVDKPVLTDVLDLYERGELDPAAILTLFSSGALQAERYTQLRQAFENIIHNNLAYTEVLRQYQCSDNDVE